MKFETWLLVIVLAAGVFGTRRQVRLSRSPAERIFTARLALFCWLVGFGFLVALVFLPTKLAILLLIPLFLSVVSLGQAWRRGRQRIREKLEPQDPLSRARRIN